MKPVDNALPPWNTDEIVRRASSLGWRRTGEQKKHLKSVVECIKHAAKGGIRAGSSAFFLRSGLGMVMALSKFRKTPSKRRLSVVLQGLFGAESFKYAAMLGIFVAVYKLVLNSLYIVCYEPRNETLRRRQRQAYAVIAGALAGAAGILFQDRKARLLVAQQMFVRGLQGVFSALSDTYGIRIPHGDVAVFCLSCAQIVYAFFFRQDTLPHSYVTWLQESGKMPRECISMNLDLVRDHRVNVTDIDNILRMKDITPDNRTALLTQRARALAQPPSYGPYFGPCAAVHPAHDSCMSLLPPKFWVVFKWLYPVYGVLNVAALLLFRRRQLFKDPLKSLSRATWNAGRSTAFVGTMILLNTLLYCQKHNLWTYLTSLRTSRSSSTPSVMMARLARLLPQRLIDGLISQYSFWVVGLLGGLAIFLEDERRRAELAVYVLPKALESAWKIARGRGLVFDAGEYGGVWLTSIAMGMVMGVYQNDPQHLSGLVRGSLYQFVGAN